MFGLSPAKRIADALRAQGILDDSMHESIGIIESQDEKPGGIAVIFGKWPGDETDEEIARVLEEIS